MASGTVASKLVLAKTTNGNFDKSLGDNNFSPFKGKLFRGNAIETLALIKSLDQNYKYAPASHTQFRPAVHYAFSEMNAEVQNSIISPDGRTPNDAVLTCTFVMAGLKPDKENNIAITGNGIQLKLQLPSKQLAGQIGDGLALAVNFRQGNFNFFCENFCSGTVIALRSEDFISLKLVPGDDWRAFNMSRDASESSFYLPNLKPNKAPGLKISVKDYLSAPASRKEGLMGFVAAGWHEVLAAPLHDKRPLLLIDDLDPSFKVAEYVK